MTTIAGCFGKLPQLGDFVTRRLPRAFVEPWDEFLRELVAGSREALGPQWLDVYLQAPIWRFVLPAGVAGEMAAAGVLMPSVDKVGRYFPLTISVLVPSAAVDVRHPWFDNAEALSLDTLDDGFDPASLNSRLDMLGTLECRRDLAQGVHWLTFGSHSVGPASFRAASLPEGAQCAALLDGDFARWDWDIVHDDAARQIDGSLRAE